MRLPSQLLCRNRHRFPTALSSGGAGRQRQQCDVGRHDELPGRVPASLIEQQHGVRDGGDGLRDLGQVKAHRRGGARSDGRSCSCVRRGPRSTERLFRNQAEAFDLGAQMQLVRFEEEWPTVRLWVAVQTPPPDTLLWFPTVQSERSADCPDLGRRVPDAFYVDIPQV